MNKLNIPVVRVALEGLPAKIANLVKAKPRTIRQLRDLTGYSIDAIRVRLYRLEGEGRVHRVYVARSFGFEYHWHIGPAPVTTDAPAPVPAPGDRRAAVRDPLIAALFGPARQHQQAAGVLGGEG